MAWTYLQLVNRVLTRLNEVNLTSSTFTTAVGFQAAVQGYINDALNDIYDGSLNWPFLWAQKTDTLTNYTQIYNLPATQTEVDWDSFYLLGNFAGTPPWAPRKLKLLDYHAWQEQYQADDEEIVDLHNLSLGNNGSIPDFVVPRQDMSTYIISRPPDTQQTTGSAQFYVQYDYWFKPTDLVNYTDTMVVPDMFSKVVLDGATMYAYMFRDNVEEAASVEKKFNEGLAEMQRRLVNKEQSMRSDQVIRA